MKQICYEKYVENGKYFCTIIYNCGLDMIIQTLNQC